MSRLDHAEEIGLGPARLWVAPLEPWVWQPAALRAPGPACLCLELLPPALARWRGVVGPAGAPVRATAPHLTHLPVAALPVLLEALCPPWLSDEEDADLQALERHLRAGADYPGLDCPACRDQEARGEGAPDCAACPRTPPPDSAWAALALYPLAVSPAAQAWQGRFLDDLPPRRARLLAMRLDLIHRLLGRPARTEALASNLFPC